VPESASFVRPAVLLKDFVLEEYQLIEARAAGADTALLIVALLSDERLAELIKVRHKSSWPESTLTRVRFVLIPSASVLQVARDLGMEPLVEVATEEETERSVDVSVVIVDTQATSMHIGYCVPQGCTNRSSIHRYQQSQSPQLQRGYADHRSACFTDTS